MNIAIVNFALTSYPVYGQKMAGFRAFTQAVYDQAETSSGMIGVARPKDPKENRSFFESEWGDWGPFTLPRYYRGSTQIEAIAQASALSVWASLSQLHSFVYRGVHLQSIQRKKKWFAQMEYPGYALWWTDEPFATWRESAARLEHLLDVGPTRHAFTFRSPFDPSGDPTTLRECLTKKI